MKIVLGLIFVAAILFLIGLSFYGLYLAFSVSIILGFLALLLEPSPFVIGVLMFFFNLNIPQMIVDYVK